MNPNDWLVEADERSWTLFWEHGFMEIMSASHPRLVAIDAATEFMDRFIKHDYPPECEHVGDLMDYCARKAIEGARR